MFGDGKPAGMGVVISGSMTPTLQTGDRIAEFMLQRAPRRGDILIFRHPHDPDGVPWVKRLIGLPGDRVQMRGGRLFLNGVEVARTPVRQVTYLDPANNHRSYSASEYAEQLPDEALPHVIHEMSDSGPLDDTPEFLVPPGALFMMGDNRDNSDDSRVPSGHSGHVGRRKPGTRYTSVTLPEKERETGIGFVPLANVIARVGTVLFTIHPCDAGKSKAAGAICLDSSINKRL